MQKGRENKSKETTNRKILLQKRLLNQPESINPQIIFNWVSMTSGTLVCAMATLEWSPLKKNKKDHHFQFLQFKSLWIFFSPHQFLLSSKLKYFFCDSQRTPPNKKKKERKVGLPTATHKCTEIFLTKNLKTYINTVWAILSMMCHADVLFL